MNGIRGAVGSGARPYKDLNKQELFKRLRAAESGGDDSSALSMEIMERQFNYSDYQQPIQRKTRERDALLDRAKTPDIAEAIALAMKKHAARVTGAIEDLQKKGGDRADPDQAVSDAELALFYNEVHGAAFETLLAEYRQGRLFAACDYGFMSFLQATRAVIASDSAAFVGLRDAAERAHQDMHPGYRSALAMYDHRIRPGIRFRARFLDKEGRVVNPDHLDPDTAKEYWRWWKKYNTATVTYKWTDDSGIAYDPRTFPGTA